MAINGRGGWSEAEAAELWRRWRAGQRISEIGEALGRAPGTVFRKLQAHGGIVPYSRRRSPHALRIEEREEISRALARGDSLRQIAQRIARSVSTISREVRRNGGREHYRATDADVCAWERARRPKPCKLAQSPGLRQQVEHKLRGNWSPAQIAGWLKRRYPHDKARQVSHETIYRSLFIQGRGTLKKELLGHLRSGRKFRRAKSGATPRHSGHIVEGVSIRERPAEVEDRAVPGHWEGDLIVGARNSYIATLVERQSRFVLLVKVPSKQTADVVPALARNIRRLPSALRRSLTWDRGLEMAKHKEFTVATDVQVYFCDPHSPWQRGSNENTNGLLRQYFPKGTDLSVYSQRELDRVALELNQRPRKTLGFETPADKLQELLQ